MVNYLFATEEQKELADKTYRRFWIRNWYRVLKNSKMQITDWADIRWKFIRSWWKLDITEHTFRKSGADLDWIR